MRYKVKFVEFTLKEGSGVFASSDAYELVKRDFSPLQESVFLLVLNAANKTVSKREISRGGMSAAVLNPADIFRFVLLAGGSRFIICHNHPSGSLGPSADDISVTAKLNEAAKMIGVSMLDHIIFSETQYYSFKDDGLVGEMPL